MSDKVKGRRLTNRQSVDMLAQDPDIHVIPPLRIKLESTGPADRGWLRSVHGDLEGDSVLVVKMTAGGDIVRGFDGDDLSDIFKDKEDT